MKILPVEDTGSLETSVYLVNVRGFSVDDPESCCDRIYAPIPTAATLTTASLSHGRCFGGVESVVEEAEEAWRLQDRDIQVPVVEEGRRNERRPCPGSRGFMDRNERWWLYAVQVQ